MGIAQDGGFRSPGVWNAETHASPEGVRLFAEALHEGSQEVFLEARGGVFRTPRSLSVRKKVDLSGNTWHNAMTQE